MKSSADLSAERLEKIAEIYAEQAMANRAAINNADIDAANTAYDLVSCCSKELKRRGPEGQQVLLSLLTNPDADVRFCAAIDVLQFAPELGETELARLANSKYVCGAKASLVLQHWKSGKMKAP